MSTSALMGHHHFGGDVPVFRIRGILLYRLKFGERLKTVFAEKAAAFQVIIGDGHFPVPYFPIMAVSVVVVTFVAERGERRGWTIVCARSMFFHHFRQYHMILVGELFPYFFCIFRILPFVFPFPAPAEPGIVTFVVTAPQGNTGMIS